MSPLAVNPPRYTGHLAGINAEDAVWGLEKCGQLQSQ